MLKIKETLIFVDEEDLEERYGKDLYIGYLEEELQSYKDKEDKIREYIKNEYFKREQIGIYDKKFQEFEVNKILQILNEGSDGNE